MIIPLYFLEQIYFFIVCGEMIIFINYKQRLISKNLQFLYNLLLINLYMGERQKQQDTLSQSYQLFYFSETIILLIIYKYYNLKQLKRYTFHQQNLITSTLFSAFQISYLHQLEVIQQIELVLYNCRYRMSNKHHNICIISYHFLAIGGLYKIFLGVKQQFHYCLTIASENLIISQNVIITAWFKVHQLSTASGRKVTLPEIAAALNSYFSPMIYDFKGTITYSLITSALICIFSLCCAIMLLLFDILNELLCFPY
ncbi:unnamed protein product (macronuclear) [Paramecium tetraurelia]|uniref:Transmembrane protein n=1 Tax=Paramecium tetraurelia TaxID=5888 RepID=A0EHX5_PARTE|nr:uncharacterized protein GSPATT00027243001 [Paramecium tetraurelia]CAK94916.1 unnamed protein product [Paramecium tetraurelia]|eukprot:XP_001462289.1 hypothetical protein (macronuclear) [Paramecium tetraurelia strain d4-2]